MNTETPAFPVEKNQKITHAHIERSLTYAQYRRLMKERLAENETTGPDQSEKLLSYTRLNDHRMDRIEKSVKLLPELRQVLEACDKPLYWLVLCEAWCGDGAQNLPILSKMAGLSSCIELRILLRDENLDIMDAHLTNGGRSIPKLICLEKNMLREIGEWGPRPSAAQHMVEEFKRGSGSVVNKEELERNIHLWYANDRGLSLQHEFMQLLAQWEL
jgi:hypothetical protein